MLQGLEMGEEGSSEVSPIVFGELESSHPFSTQCAILQSKVINAEGMQSQGLNPSVWISRTHLTHGESESKPLQRWLRYHYKMAKRVRGTSGGRDEPPPPPFLLLRTALLLSVLHNQFSPTITFSERIYRFKNVKMTRFWNRHEMHGKGHMYRWISWMLSRTTMFGNNEMIGWEGVCVCVCWGR